MSEEAAQILSQTTPPEVKDTPVVDPSPDTATLQIDESQSQKFDSLARRERQAMIKIKQARQREEELKRKEQELSERESKYKSWEETKTKAKLNPRKYLEEAGLSYNDVVDFELTSGLPPTADMEVKSIKSELEKMREDNARREEELKKEAAQRAQEQFNETVNQFKSDLHDYVHSKPEAYEWTIYEGVEHLVFDVIQQHMEEGMKAYREAIEAGETPPKPQVLDKTTAAEMVEDYVVKRTKGLKNTKKFKSVFELEQEAKAEEPKPQGFTPSKTLTNVSGSATPKPEFSSSMTRNKIEEDAWQRALAKL